MYPQIIGIQCISIILVLIECWVIFKNWKGVLHSYLFLSCIAILVNNVGYLMEITSSTEEAFFKALLFSYAGRIWISYGLFMFIVELVRFKLPNWVRNALALTNIITYVMVITTKKTGLYYYDMNFTMDGQMPVFIRKNGIFHSLWFVIVEACAFLGMVLLIRAFVKEKNSVSKRRIFTVILAIVTPTIFFVLEATNLIPLSNIYDLTMIGYPLSTVFMLIAIFKYKLLDTRELAREYAVDELSAGIIALDDKGNISYFNKPAMTIFPDLSKDPTEVIAKLQKSVSTGIPLQIADKVYSTESNSLEDNGTTVGTIYSVIDDTEHYAYMSVLENQKRVADAANKAKSRFLANMSHEIRTPINAVLGMDEMILRESREKDILSYAADIKSAGRTLLSLINDILDFSKIEEGRMEIIPTQYELSSVVNDLSNIVKGRAEKKGLKLIVDVNHSVPHLLYGDEVRIKQIAINLLTNSIKYTETGTITLNIDYEKISEEEIDLSFVITDTGVGMKPEDLDKLFSPFTRIEESRHRSVEGTGLGMSIVKQLLDLMGSHLDVKSTYGEGSEFSFTIRQKVLKWEPIGDDLERFGDESEKIPEYKELFHAPGARILAVDDTEVNLAVVKNLLKLTQIQIDTATSGTEAINAFSSNKYDIVFIDHMMPDMDGLETLKRIKELPGADEVTFIVFTANAVSGAREMYLEAGFEDYISKPVDGRRLEELILRYLPKDKIISPEESPAPVAETSSVAKRNRILVVDDDEVICASVSQILGKSFEVFTCNEAEQAESEAFSKHPDLILLDLNLGGISGFEILQNLKKNPSTDDIPVMILTADEDGESEALGLKNGALDFIRKPVVPEVLMQRCKNIVSLDHFQKDLQGEVSRQSLRAERITREMMVALSHTVDAKDHYTKGHSERVAAYAAEIGRRMGKSPEEQRQLYEVGLLHDIGKIGISEEILNKTQRLSDTEFAQIKTHAVIGHDILTGIEDMPELALGARSHHERFDGRGYPDGLTGHDIPEVARIICVADCYDAMTSTRTYSVPKPQEKVREEFIRCSNYQFDPVIAKVMIAMIDEDVEYHMTERNSQGTVWKNKDECWDSYDTAESLSSIQPQNAPSAPQHTEEAEWLKQIPELDADLGVTNCGSFESLVSVAKIFHQTARHKADEIEQLWNTGDIEKYTIKVHALKSSARIIGAKILSDLAKELEAAGRASDKFSIDRDTPILLEKYRNLDLALSAFDEEVVKKPKLTAKMRAEALETISMIAGAMDYDMMENLIKDLKSHTLSHEDEELVDRLEKEMMQLNWEAITKLVREQS